MTQLDKVIVLKLTRTAPIAFADLYKAMKDWAGKNEYLFSEKRYDDIIEKSKKTTKIEWSLGKELDEYNAFLIKITINMRNYQTLQKGNKRIMKGSLSIEFEGTVATDYEEKWTKGPFMVFLRGIYDKFITQSKRDKLEAELKEEVNRLYNHTKKELSALKYK